MNCPELRCTWSDKADRARLGRMRDLPHYPVATVRQGRGRAFFVVAMHVQGFVVGAARCEPISQTGITPLATDTGSQPRFEEQERASQITARLIRNGQVHRAMRVKSPARFFNRLTALQQANNVG